jgi:hypothetical protein
MAIFHIAYVQQYLILSIWGLYDLLRPLVGPEAAAKGDIFHADQLAIDAPFHILRQKEHRRNIECE